MRKFITFEHEKEELVETYKNQTDEYEEVSIGGQEKLIDIIGSYRFSPLIFETLE